MLNKIKKIIPKAIKNIIKKAIGREDVRNSDIIPAIKQSLRSDVVTVLDVGCGKLWEGNPKEEDILFSVFNDSQYKITGIDIFAECITWRKEHGPKGKYEVMDVRDLSMLPGKFDVVVCHHVLEHFPKDESIRILESIEQKAAKQIIIGTPVGFTDTEYAVKLHHNESERHLCAWEPVEFRERGYDVREIKGALLAVKYV